MQASGRTAEEQGNGWSTATGGPQLPTPAMEVHAAGLLGGGHASWPQMHKQCYSDNASSGSSISAVQIQSVSPQRMQLAHGWVQKPREHSLVDSDTTGAQLQQPALLHGSPPDKSSNAVPEAGFAQRTSSRVLRKRQRASGGSGDHHVHLKA